MVSQCQTIKKLWAGHETAQTDGQTDGQTDRESDFYIPPEHESWKKTKKLQPSYDGPVIVLCL